MTQVPPYLDWLRDRPDGVSWLDELPALVDRAVERWDLTLGEPYAQGGMCGCVTRATTADGEAAVLKLQWPHRESEHEAEALRVWGGDGAVRLLAFDPDDHAILMERAEPGTLLVSAPPDEVVGALLSLARRLTVPAGAPFTSLADEATHWIASLREPNPLVDGPDADLADTAIGLLTELAPTQGPPVLLHQDLHAENVVAAQREPWLAIDPKPLAGEVEFVVAPMVRDFDLGHSRAAVHHRLDRACEELGLDRERALGWTIAQTVAWSYDNAKTFSRHVQTVRWLLD